MVDTRSIGTGSDLDFVHFHGVDPPPRRHRPERTPEQGSPLTHPARFHRMSATPPATLDAFSTWLLERAGLCANAYRAVPLHRRLPAVLRRLRVDSPNAAQRLLEARPELLPSALDALLIGVSAFFRDTSVFEYVRASILPTLLKTAALQGDEQGVLGQICEMVHSLIGRGIECVAVVEKQDSELVVNAQAGLPSLESDRWPLKHSLAAIAMEHGRTASVHDLAERPDLIVPHAPGVAMRSSMATPIHIDGDIVGAMEVHSTQPRAWSTREFQLLEWAAMQSGLIMQIHRLRAGLEQLVDERTARLQELVDELEHFSYSITHDMRAPLRAMQGFAGILVKESSNLSEKQVQYLDHIMQSASRMDRLITDSLNYTKAMRTDLRLARVDAQRLFEGIIKSYPNLQPPHARVEIEGTLPSVLSNEAGLTQCFANLLNNAVKFVPPGQQPHVTVRAEKFDGSVRFWIEDNGIGISPEFQPYLFQMFRRASADYDGTGIGLALVKKTCERMNGKVGVVSEPGRGSQFWVELQAAHEIAKQESMSLS